MRTEDILKRVSERIAASADQQKLYIARIEIHKPNFAIEKYEKMYAMLEEKGFVKEITRGAQDYELPNAMYAKNAPTGMAQTFTKDVFEAVKKITGDLHPEVLIVEVEEIDFMGLKLVPKTSGIKAAQVLSSTTK